LGPGPHEGRVKWYDHGKGYGFIAHPGGEEVFFHRTGIAPGEIPDFPDGTPVTYLVEQTTKGPQAVDVERTDAEGDI
jgi:CspA family cold shock protein